MNLNYDADIIEVLPTFGSGKQMVKKILLTPLKWCSIEGRCIEDYLSDTILINDLNHLKNFLNKYPCHINNLKECELVLRRLKR